MNLSLAVRIDRLKIQCRRIRDRDPEFFKRFPHAVNIHSSIEISPDMALEYTALLYFLVTG